MPLPNYHNGSIVNLMSSIATAFGSNTLYHPLKGLDIKQLKQSKNIVLLLIDGFGYEYLRKNGRSSFLWKHLHSKITSVFPSTTAAAITSVNTGEAPQQHAHTGWFMLYKELGIVSKPLRFSPRIKGMTFDSTTIKPKELYASESFFSKLPVSSYAVMGHDIKGSAYSKALQHMGKPYGYSTLTGYFQQIRKIITLHARRKFIYAYWPYFDDICHDLGTESQKLLRHFRQIDREMKRFIESIKGTSTAVILTADHGLIDGPMDKKIWIDQHPKLEECLTLPLCGEPRMAYCYVKPSKAKQFEEYVKTKMKKYCWLHKSEDLVRKGYFGLGTPNPKLFDRIGDYCLIMKEHYTIKDRLLSEPPAKHIAHHGGISKEEMWVPLVIFE